MTARPYQICSFCVMDTSDPKIVFDERGECNHCRRWREREERYRREGTFAARRLEEQLEKIRAAGRNADYDCILGVSGGMDSSYMATLLHRWELRPLCVHLDNGWNTGLSQKNIERIIRTYRWPLRTHVLDWEEFRDLQIAYLKSSVVDAEVPTDHAIGALIWREAAAASVRTVIGASNRFTESIMPYSWNHVKWDPLNLIAIWARYGTRRPATYPFYDGYRRWYYESELKIGHFNPLDFVPFRLDEVEQTLKREFGWEGYGTKHSESIFTRFYQNYLLPKKFGIDKRRAFLSNLVCSAQITREAALAALAVPPDPVQAEEDRIYVMKKLGLSEEAFRGIMESAPRDHYDFPSGAPRRG